jgi:peptidoglycan hydrolase-like protein with peptidoglycan-binding domain
MKRIYSLFSVVAIIGLLCTSVPVFAITSNVNYSSASFVDVPFGFLRAVQTGPGAMIVGNTKILGTADSPFGTVYFTTDSSGVVNDGYGRLSGKAWNTETGWIDFAPEAAKRVTIDIATGQFQGFAKTEKKGWIVFDCSVNRSCMSTFWKPGIKTEEIHLTPILTKGVDSLGNAIAIEKELSFKEISGSAGIDKLACDETISNMKPVVVDNEEDQIREVLLVQKFLNRYEKAGLQIDGDYKPADVKAVKKWQQKNAEKILYPSGMNTSDGSISLYSYLEMARIHKNACGTASAQANISQKTIIQQFCPMFTQEKQYGDKGSEVRKIQYFLKYNQKLVVPVNGEYNQRTANAVKAFQRFNGITAENQNGVWGSYTMSWANKAAGCE